MKKRIALLVTIALVLTPATISFADSYSEYNSFISLSYGHNGSSHFTSYSARYSRAESKTWVSGVYTCMASTNIIGGTAYTSVPGASSAVHTHSYNEW